VREDRQDLIYKTKREKFNAINDEIERLYKLELPVLVGTVSVDVSETLSRMLKRRGIPHNVLNAKYHEREATIVAEAGRKGAVTIATNMAGRGTDIKLGEGVREPRTVAWCKEHGLDPKEVLTPADPARALDANKLRDDDVIEPGGLHIIGSERHESRRIDRQLRGRAGRQGDPGATEFFLSLEDDLMRLFNSDRIAGIMERMGAEEGEVISHGLVTRSIGSAQRRVEMQNFEARKRLLEYDDVMNQQREVIYDLRLFALEGGEDLRGEVWEMIEHAISAMVDEYLPAGGHSTDWDLPGLRQRLVIDYFMVVDELPTEADADSMFTSRDEVHDLVVESAHKAFHRKLESWADHRDRILSWVLLGIIDEKWREHLYDLDHLKASIGFRGWGQKDPLVEYKQEAYEMFVELMGDIRKSVGILTFRAQLAVPQPQPAMPRRVTLSGPSDTPETGASVRPVQPEEVEKDTDPMAGMVGGRRINPSQNNMDVRRLQTNREDENAAAQQPATSDKTVGRNDPCPCGSGKKYKKCHGVGMA
jgi:preprotein translocase subunit SecA